MYTCIGKPLHQEGLEAIQEWNGSLDKAKSVLPVGTEPSEVYEASLEGLWQHTRTHDEMGVQLDKDLTACKTAFSFSYKPQYLDKILSL